MEPTLEDFGQTTSGPGLLSIHDLVNDGVCAPIRLLSQSQIRLLRRHHRNKARTKAHPWEKALCALDPLIHDLASAPRFVSMIKPFLGNDIIFWGASYVVREPGREHSWHVDAEAEATDKRFLSVWIAIENASLESSLKFIGGSHRLEKSLGRLQHERGLSRHDLNDDVVLSLAREADPEARLIHNDIDNGDAIVFAGRTWHGSLNQRTAGTRTALLLQYAEASAAVRIPKDFLKWPRDYLSEPKPPVVAVNGTADTDANEVFGPPSAARPNERPIGATIYQPEGALHENTETGWAPHKYFHGSTQVHTRLSCHASVLSPGMTPHPPHSHVEEEILIVLNGEGELQIGTDADTRNVERKAARPGTVAYYPAYWYHTLCNTGTHPLTYLMFKWQGSALSSNEVLPANFIQSDGFSPEMKKAFRTKRLFEGPTNFLGTLHMHLSEVDPGGGYDPHRDSYDVAIVVLSGQIEVQGEVIGPFGVAYYEAEFLHGLRGVGPEVARYLVIEFRNGPAAKRNLGTNQRPAFVGARANKRKKRTRMEKYRNSLSKRIRRFWRFLGQ